MEYDFDLNQWDLMMESIPDDYIDIVREKTQRYLRSSFARERNNPQEKYFLYLRYITDFFDRYATQFGTSDIAELAADVREHFGWIAFMPEVLKDHDFANAEYAAFAINLKNVFDRPSHEESAILPSNIASASAFLVPPRFNSIVNVCDGISYRFMDVGRVIRAGDYYFMRMMVKYGVIRPTFQLSSTYMLEDYIMWLTEDKSLSSGSNRLNHFEKASTAADRLLLYESKKHLGHEKDLLRLQTVANAISILLKPNPKSRKLELEENVLACVNLYFEAIPEPFVNLLEIHRLLQSAHETRENHSISRIVESFDRFRDVFPDCDVDQPRTLKHLSRYALRESLCKRGLLPQLISQLPVPQVIKNYIQIV